MQAKARAWERERGGGNAKERERERGRERMARIYFTAQGCRNAKNKKTYRTLKSQLYSQCTYVFLSVNLIEGWLVIFGKISLKIRRF